MAELTGTGAISSPNKDESSSRSSSSHDSVTQQQGSDVLGKPIIVIVGASSKFDITSVKLDGDGDAARSGTPKDDDPPNWGLGGVLAVPFAAEGYNIVLMGRRMEVLEEVKRSVELVHQQWRNNQNNKSKNQEDDPNRNGHRKPPQPQVLSVVCDVTDNESVERAFRTVEDQVGNLFHCDSYIDGIIFNVAPPYPPGFKFEGWGDVLLPHQIDTSNMTFQVDTLVNGLIRVCRQPAAMPAMLRRRRGCVLISGESCCNLRGRHEFGAVSPARAALRSLGQCMYTAYGPLGIHVCHMNIGGIIDTPRTRQWKMRPELTDPNEIAGQFLNAYRQPSTVWSYEIQLHPGFSAREVDMRM